MKSDDEQLAETNLRNGSFADILDHIVSGRSIFQIDGSQAFPTAPVAVARAYRQLQDVADYRTAIRAWFETVATGGHLIIVVPHAFLYERRLALPSPWRKGQRRLYTPASLLQEVEEALAPNSYRVRWLGDLDRGYDYAASGDVEPLGEADVALILERITPPAWPLTPRAGALASKQLSTPDFQFEPARTRIELNVRQPAKRILILKLDHLGDFIMGLPALERARSYFADATIDLVVGTWNAQMAREIGIADRVIEFDAFPRNSTEQEPNVEATLGEFRTRITERYDLAIDLRTDVDTRTLLRAVNAPVKAGIGRRSQFPFLDIALPLDGTRNEAENARDDRIAHDRFFGQRGTQRRHFSNRFEKTLVDRSGAIFWGPYLEVPAGEYIFDFHIDLDEDYAGGLLRLDIALNGGEKVAEMFVSGPAAYHLPFRVDSAKATFEARIWAVDDYPPMSFNFHGGHLLTRAPANVLHQSDYAALLIEHVKLCMQDLGMLADVSQP